MSEVKKESFNFFNSDLFRHQTIYSEVFLRKERRISSFSFSGKKQMASSWKQLINIQKEQKLSNFTA